MVPRASSGTPTKTPVGGTAGRQGAHDGVRVGPGSDLTPGNTGDVDDARRGALQERKHQQGVAHPPRDANNFLQLWGNRPTRYEKRDGYYEPVSVAERSDRAR